MPYVERKDGGVSGLFSASQPGYAEEFLPEDHPEVLAFRIRRKKEEDNGEIKAELANIDARSIRAIREYLLQSSDAPSNLRELEIQAISERLKLK